jgi:tetratricopeptide (TPR) repeat protein
MGIVYLAEQERPIRRQVALKVIKPGMDSKRIIARFEAERQALALLDHPNIAHVFDAGTTENGRPYFVMEYVKGLPITEHCDKHKLSVDNRLDLFLKVCHGIQHAHQKGIIHRDIKPSNILVSVQSDQTVPKMIDFDVARALSQTLTDRTLYTEQGQLVGTPEYMSPEQTDMANQDIDTRSDVYSLGVLLYVLLTGVLPFDPKTLREGGIDQLRNLIRETDPKTPSTSLSRLGEEAKKIADTRHTNVGSLVKRLRKELEWIPLKAMRKEPSRRYQSASELASDVQNYLSGVPLLAGPESSLYRIKKFVRRHWVPLTATAAVVVALMVGLVISTAMYFRAEQERTEKDKAKHAVAELERDRYLSVAQRLHAEGRYRAALSEIEKNLAQEDVSLESRLLYARLLLEVGQSGKAVAELEQLLDEGPEIAGPAHYLLANVYLDSDSTRAEQHKQKAESLLPQTAEAYFLRTMTAGTITENINCLSLALELDPSHYPSREARALVYYMLRDYQKMQQDVEAMVVIRPKDSLGYNLRAQIRRQTDEFEKAISDHNRAIEFCDNEAELPDLYDQRRQTYYLNGDYERALSDAIYCIKLRPNQVSYRFNVLGTLLAMERYDEAKAEYAKIMKSGGGIMEDLQNWAAKHVFNALGTHGPLHLPDPNTANAAFKAMHEAVDYYHNLSVKAKRIVTRGFRAAWSPDATELAYSRGLPGACAIEVLNLQSGRTRLLAISGKDPSWAPDGRYIAYVRERQTLTVKDIVVGEEPDYQYLTQEEIWIIQPSGEGQRRLAKGSFPSWSLDSRRIFYYRKKKGVERVTDLCVISVDARNAQPETIISNQEWHTYPSISPDEKLLAYLAYDAGRELRITELATGKVLAKWEVPLGSPGMFTTWSPDGRELSVGGYDFSTLGLWIYNIETQEAVKILSGPVTLGAWSPDGLQMALDIRYPYFEIWVADILPGTTAARSLGPGRTIEEHYNELVQLYSQRIEADPENAQNYKLRARMYRCLNHEERYFDDMQKYSELILKK